MIPSPSSYLRPLDFKHGRIDMSHGAGGRASAQLIDELFVPALDNDALRQGNDQAELPTPPELLRGGRLVMSTDAHVVSPIFFPGGDLGSLAVHGTLNDVAMAGARPLSLAASFIIEAGYPLAELQRIVASMAQASRAAGVPVITGDTKVVEPGKGDGVFITTTGIGVVPAGLRLDGAAARPGDAVLLSGSIGEHGVAVLSKRESLEFDTTIESDSAALHGLVQAMLLALGDQAGAVLRLMRDPTRGGLASTLNEIARQSACRIELDEAAIVVQPQVAAACELLGLDPLYVANEGKLVAVCAPEAAASLLAAMRAHPLGQHAACIGQVQAEPVGQVQMRTRLGGRRMVDWLTGEQLPRIC